MTRRMQRLPVVRAVILLCPILLAACATATPPPAPTPVAAPTRPSLSTPAVARVAVPIAADVLVVAQRGGAALAPENTLSAFANAIKIGVDMVGCDAHLSRDGAVVVIGDADLARTTDGTGLISSLTLAELRKLNAAAKFGAGRWPAERVPTLAEILDAAKGKVGVQIEIETSQSLGRYPAIEQKVIGLIRERHMLARVLIICADYATLVDVKRIEPDVRTGLAADAAWMAARADTTPEELVVEVVEGTGADCFLAAAGSLSEALVEAAHAGGLEVGAWAVNASADMQRLARYGVDIIATDRPDELMRVLGR